MNEVVSCSSHAPDGGDLTFRVRQAVRREGGPEELLQGWFVERTEEIVESLPLFGGQGQRCSVPSSRAANRRSKCLDLLAREGKRRLAPGGVELNRFRDCACRRNTIRGHESPSPGADRFIELQIPSDWRPDEFDAALGQRPPAGKLAEGPYPRATAPCCRPNECDLGRCGRP